MSVKFNLPWEGLPLENRGRVSYEIPSYRKLEEIRGRVLDTLNYLEELDESPVVEEVTLKRMIEHTEETVELLNKVIKASKEEMI